MDFLSTAFMIFGVYVAIALIAAGAFQLLWRFVLKGDS